MFGNLLLPKSHLKTSWLAEDKNHGMAPESLGQDFGQGSAGMAFSAPHGVSWGGSTVTGASTIASLPCLAAAAGWKLGSPTVQEA